MNRTNVRRAAPLAPSALWLRTLQLHGDFAILSQLWLGAAHRCLQELPDKHRGAGGPVPELGDHRVNPQKADVGIVISGPPHVVSLAPKLPGLCHVMENLGATGDRQI